MAAEDVTHHSVPEIVINRDCPVSRCFLIVRRPGDDGGADPSETIYHGLWHQNGGSEIAIEDEDGHRVGTVRHVPKSSPTGMNWGYAGSGPADAARSLLIEVLGEDAICPVCAGTGRVVYVGDDAEGMPQAEPFDPERHPWAQRGWICKCDEGYRHLPYSRFTSEFVIHWGKEWTMSRDSILQWLNSTSQTGPEPGA